MELVAELGKDTMRGEFRLGVIHTIGPYLLPDLIASLRRVAPRLTLYIEESMTALLADAIKYGNLEAAIIALPFEIPGIETQALYDEPFQVIVPRGHPWEARTAIHAGEVSGEEVLVLKAGNCFREQVLDACPEISHAEGSRHQGHSIETIRCMVASGYGISVLPEACLCPPYESDLVTAIPFEPPEPCRRVALAWRRGQARPQVINALTTAVRGIRKPCYRLL